MTGREKAAAVIAAVLTVGITAYSAWKMLAVGVLSWHIRQPEFLLMAAELLVIGGLFYFLFRMISDSRKLFLAVGVLIASVSWLHEIFLPVIGTGTYTCYLALVGMWFGRTWLRKRMDFCWNILIGSGVTITVFCLLSLIRLGSITNLRIWVALSGVGLLIWYRVVCARDRESVGNPGVKSIDWPKTKGTAAMLATIVALLLLQAARLNLAVDFDSIWYGVRSDVILDSGTGIYENLGTLGVVYTYSKGLETLTLPLAGLPSYSFITAMNLWIGALVLLASYRTARIVLKPGSALWVPFLLAAIPGIMNMAVTAKADLMTLFCQILMLQGMLWYIKEQRGDWLAAGLAAYGLSLTLKPTAVVFSTAIAGMSFLWLLWRREWYRIRNRRVWRLVLLSAATLAGIWGRTLYLVGVPVTSVFYQVFQKLGFQVKYPFYASGFPSVGSGWSFWEKLAFLGRRLWGVLVFPQGEDMAHVIIAWGTLLPVVLLVLWLAFGKRFRPSDEEKKILSYFIWLLIPIGVVNLVSLYSLSQIDGNYYMLYDLLAVLTGVIWIEGQNQEKQKVCRLLLFPAWVYAAIFCGLTNWAWALGNGGIHPVNRGYYAHVEEAYQERIRQGSEAIWNILASDPRNRVIALGEHPGVLTFPCWVQSYVDVSGYWGNPDVVANAPNFLQYLQFADVDYIYMEKEYVDTSVRIYQIIRTLVEEGQLDDVRDENGNLILTVRKPEDAPVFEESIQKNLQVFDERYIQHP